MSWAATITSTRVRTGNESRPAATQGQRSVFVLVTVSVSVLGLVSVLVSVSVLGLRGAVT